MSSNWDLLIFIFCFIIVFLILHFLEILGERRKKSVSVECNFATVYAFKRPAPAAYVILLLSVTWSIWVFVLQVTTRSHKMLFTFNVAANISIILSFFLACDFNLWLFLTQIHIFIYMTYCPFSIFRQPTPFAVYDNLCRSVLPAHFVTWSVLWWYRTVLKLYKWHVEWDGKCWCCVAVGMCEYLNNKLSSRQQG
jgi:hypothetical protein